LVRACKNAGDAQGGRLLDRGDAMRLAKSPPLASVRVPRQAVIVFIGLQLAMVMSSLDGTIVATALPTITKDIGGFSRVTWVATAYLMAQVVSMPLYGKLGDQLGRKRILLSAVVLFVVGSMACGLSQTMNQLLVARFFQGLGGGGLGVVSMAVTADIIPAKQLGRWMGYQGVAFGVASVLGPLIGGLFVDHLSWRWAFYINLPIGLVAFAIIATRLSVPYRRQMHSLDWLGALLIMITLSSFTVLASIGGTDFSWTSGTAIGFGVVIIGAGVSFWLWERRAVEPVIPLRLFSDSVIRGNVGINLTSGLLLFCGIYFVPLYMQEVHGISPTASGLVLIPVMFGAAFGTLISGRRVERGSRIKPWPIAGAVFAICGMSLLSLLTESTPTLLVASFVLLVGIGAGCMMQPSLLAVQNAATPADLGTATATGLLFRMLGSTVGVPIFGGLINSRLGDGPRNPTTFAHALSPVFFAAIFVGIAALLIALWTPERALKEHISEHAGLVDVLAEPVT
jgi:EmrB/QacA subfamily drug resistance transporter